MTFFSVVVVFTRKSDVKTLNKIRTIKKQSKKIISLGSIVSGLILCVAHGIQPHYYTVRRWKPQVVIRNVKILSASVF